MYFLLLSILPLLICLIGFLIFRKKPYNFQFGLLAAVLLVVIGITTGCIFHFGPEAQSEDTEIWNGRITARYSEEVSCSHSYDCNCYNSCSTDSNGHESCTRICQTCYEHDHDVDWVARTSNQESIVFSRVDRQGLEMPSRYAQAFVGEPTAIEHDFTNYFKLATHNIVANFYDGIAAPVPAYPQGFDLYRVNKLVDPDGLLSAYSRDWLYLLNDLNANLGAAKQVNVIVFVTKQSDPRYEFNVQKAWLGGKKNDVIVLIGAPSAPKIDWVRIITWSTNPAIKTSLRDDIMNIGSLDMRDAIIKAIATDVTTDFQRVHMKDQQYLRQAWEPSHTTTFFVYFLFVSLAVVGVVVIVLAGNDDEDDIYNTYR